MMPPSAGPAITPICPATPRSASALGSSSCGTSSGVSARAAGLPMTFATPETAAIARNGQSFVAPFSVTRTRSDGDRDVQAEGGRGDSPPRQTVGDLARRQREQRKRQELHQSHEAEVEWIAADRVDLPADRDREHLRRQAVREDRRPEQGERADLQRLGEPSSHQATVPTGRLGSFAWPTCTRRQSNDWSGCASCAQRHCMRGATRRCRSAAMKGGCWRVSAPCNCATRAPSWSSTGTCVTGSRTSG